MVSSFDAIGASAVVVTDPCGGGQPQELRGSASMICLSKGLGFKILVMCLHLYAGHFSLCNPKT